MDLMLSCSLVAGFKRRKGHCSGDDISTGSVRSLSQCANTCLRDSSLVAFLFDFDTNKCKLLTTVCKQTTIEGGRPNLYMYDQCKYRGGALVETQTTQKQYSGCKGVNINCSNLQMYDQCKYRIVFK